MAETKAILTAHTDMKICTDPVCEMKGTPQAIDNFFKKKRSKDGYNWHCKRCVMRKQRKPKVPKEKRDGFKKCSDVDCERKDEWLKLEEFTECAKSPDGRQYHCKQCDSRRICKRRQEIQDYINTVRASVGKCEKCGKNPLRPEDLQFAHHNRTRKYRTKNGKAINITRLGSIEKVKQELPEGKWVCDECGDADTRRENEENKSTSRSAESKRRDNMIWQQFVNKEKLRRGKCHDCGKVVTEDNVRIFDFDHRDPKSKLAAVGTLVNRQVPFAVIRAEWHKCDMVCGDCHVLRTKSRKLAGVISEPINRWKKLAAKLIIQDSTEEKNGKNYGFQKAMRRFASVI